MIVAGTLNLTLTKRCTFESVVLVMKDANSNPVNITGYTVAAQVRDIPGGTVVINLAPTITNAAGGEVTIPLIDDETTDTYTAGSYQWDLLLEDGSDNRQRVLAGSFSILNPITA